MALSRMRALRGKYPAQFWLMFVGMLVSTIGSSMVWPFLMTFVTGLLKVPLTTAASLMTINSAVALASAFLAGPVIDRFGRKWMMVVSLLGIGGVYLVYTRANSYAFVAALMALTGLFNPLYRVAADAMMADLIPPAHRPDGYALLRMANNLGIAIGPTIGGFLAVQSYDIAFYGAAAGMSLFAVLIALFARETLLRKKKGAGASEAAASEADAEVHPEPEVQHEPEVQAEPLGGYLRILRDRPFMGFITAFTLTQACAALIWILLNVHAKNNFGVLENRYGTIAMTNALMVVLFQAAVTAQTRRRAPLPVLAVGSAFYAAAVLSVAAVPAGTPADAAYWGFWFSMVIMTTGELMLMPTSTTYTANLAPAHMRGRYMSVYSLTWGVAQGIAPLTGGFLADNLGPSAPWLGGGVAGIMAVAAFVLLAMRAKAREKQLAPGD
jgi:MFS family permease